VLVRVTCPYNLDPRPGFETDLGIPNQILDYTAAWKRANPAERFY